VPTRLARADRWFPVYIRYLGSLLGVALVAATILGFADPVEYAGAYTFVTAMILYKTVHDYLPGGAKHDRGDTTGD
jgi:hypothetical protein